MFCVECGKEAGEALTSNGLCHSCFLAKTRLTALPANVDFDLCAHCRARRRGEVWLDPPDGGHRLEIIVGEAVTEALRVDRRADGVSARAAVEQEDPRNWRVTLHVTGVAEGVAFAESPTTRARVKNATCTRCSRMMGNYYESIVQVRGEGRDLTPEEVREVRGVASRVIDRIVDAGDRHAFVLKDEAVKGGLDVFVATNNAGRQMAKAIASEFGGRVKEHPKIAGQKDGVELWRITFAVRLPDYRAGDLVVIEDEPLLVAKVGPKAVTLARLATRHERHVDRERLEGANVLARRDARDAVVVSRTTTELQVLDPWTFATVTVLRPAGVPDDAASVAVLRWEDEIIAIGNS